MNNLSNDQSCVNTDYAQIATTLVNMTHILDVLVLSELSNTLLLGVDFWKSMYINPDLRQNVCNFSNDVPEICSSLSESDELVLKSIWQKKFCLIGIGLGCCHVAEYKIELKPGINPIYKPNWLQISYHWQRNVATGHYRIFQESLV